MVTIMRSFSRWLPSWQVYLRQSLRFDLLAGLTVAMVVLPQSMAYAAIAGVNPIYGIYTAIVPTIVGALFGASRVLITGPTNATALVVVGVLAGFSEHPDYVEFVFIVAILSGLIKLLLGIFRLGGIIRYISNSVLTGFLSAAAILIIIDQFGNLFGFHIPKDEGMIAILRVTAQNLGAINLPTLLTAVVTMACMLALRKIYKKLPSALLAVGLAALLVQAAGWHTQGVRLVEDVGLPDNIGLSIYIPQVPWQVIPDLLPAALAVALFSLVEAMSITKALSLSVGEKVHPSREFIGQGLAAIAGGLTQCIPSSGSPSRSAVSVGAGARTRLAGAFSGGFVWLLLMLLAGLIGYIPIPSLAGVVVISALGLINRNHILLTWKTRRVSQAVLVVTFLSTLLLPLHLAIYIGALLSILIYLYESGHLNLSILTFEPDGKVIERSIEQGLRNCPQVLVLNVEGDLYFGAVDDLDAALARCISSGAKVVVVRLRRMRLIASTGMAMLEGAVKTARKQGVEILLSGLNAETDDALRRAGLLDLLGEERVFCASEVVFESTRRAVAAGIERINRKTGSAAIERHLS